MNITIMTTIDNALSVEIVFYEFEKQAFKNMEENIR